MSLGVNSTSTCTPCNFTLPPVQSLTDNTKDSSCISFYSSTSIEHRFDQPVLHYERYREMVSRLKKDELVNLTAKIEKLPEKEISLLSEAISKADFSHEIFKSADFPFYGLAAFKKGYIDEYQFGTLQLLWSIGQYHSGFDKMEVFSLFSNDGQSNPRALELIKETLQGSLDTSRVLFAPQRTMLDFLTEEQLKQFFEEMKKLPSSEQHFFVVSDLQYDSSDTETISQRIQNGTGINIFGRVGNRQRMIPSLGMMQAVLKVKYGKDAVKINPVLGISSFKQMRKIEQRDMALHFPGVPLPPEADSFSAPWYDFTYHDFYHAIVCSAIPRSYRVLVVRVADLALDIIKEAGIDRRSPPGETLRSFFEVALDMELSSFRHEFNKHNAGLDQKAKFWIELEKFNLKAFANDNFKNFDPNTAISFYQKIAQKIVVDGEGFSLGLTEETLKNAKTQRPVILFNPKVCDLEPLKIMSNYIKQIRKGKLPQASIKVGLKSKILQEKILRVASRHYSKKLGKDFLKESLTEEQLSKLPLELREELEKDERSVSQLIIAGVSLSKLTTLQLPQLKAILFHSERIVLCLTAGASWEQIIALDSEGFEKISKKSELIIPLLERGIRLDKILQSDYLSKFLNSNEWAISNPIIALLNLGATLNDIESLPADLQELLFEDNYRIDALFNLGLSFKTLTTCNQSLLSTLLEKLITVEALLEVGFEIEELLKLDPDKFKKLVSNSYAVETLRKVGMTCGQIITMDLPILKKILAGVYQIQSLILAGVTCEQILKMDLKTLDKILPDSLQIRTLIKEAGLTFDEIIGAEPALYNTLISYNYDICKFVEAGVSPKTFFKLEIPLIVDLCKKYCYTLLKVGYSFDWVLNQLRVEKKWFASTCFYLSYFAEKGLPHTYFTSLPNEELKSLLSDASKADRNYEIKAFTSRLLAKVGKDTKDIICR